MMLSRFSLCIISAFAGMSSGAVLAQHASPAQESAECIAAGTPASWHSNTAPLQSPLLSSNGEVTLQLCAPDAHSVRVFGDWNAKSANGDLLRKDEHGVWSISFGPLKPDLYTYWFLVDGVKAIDPNNVHSANDAARIASYFILAHPETDSAMYVSKDVPHGRISAIWYSSEGVATPRRALIYTPPDYDKSEQHYPVLYLLHGWGGDENEWIDLGRASQIMDNLIAAHKVIPMIVVMPNGHHDRHAVPDISSPPSTSDLAPLPPRGYDITPSITAIGKSVVNDLVPFVDQNFRTLTDSNSRAVAGLSMGGGQSLYIGLNHPDMFAWVASFSGAVIAWPDAMMPAAAPAPSQGTEAVIPRYKLNPEAIKKDAPGLNESINAKLRLLYISCGMDDGLLSSNEEFESWLTENNIHFVQENVPGYAHVWSLWRRNLVEVAPLLFRPQLSPQHGQ